jgi:hypothetical protein
VCSPDDSTPPTISGYAPTSVTLGVNSKLVRFSVKASDDCGIDDWTIIGADELSLFVYKQNPLETIAVYDNDEAGTHYVDVEASDPNFNVHKRRFPFKLLRHAKWQTADVTPTRISKGSRVNIKATLLRADWDLDKYVRFGGPDQRVTIQFRPKTSDTYFDVKTVSFGATGQISTQVTVKREVARDGYYRLRFGGTSKTSATASVGDYVDVR